MLNIFSCASWPSECLLWRKVYLCLLPSFNRVVCSFFILSCICCLYILNINLLSFATFSNILSHSMDHLFLLTIVSFAMHKLLCFIRSHLFNFVFIFIILVGGSKNILLQFISESVLSMFSSKSFISIQCYIYIFNSF